MTVHERRKVEKRSSRPRKNSRVDPRRKPDIDDERYARLDRRDRTTPERPELAIDTHRASRKARRTRHFNPAFRKEVVDQSISRARVDGRPALQRSDGADALRTPIQPYKSLQNKAKTNRGERGKHDPGTGIKEKSGRRTPPTPRLPHSHLNFADEHDPASPVSPQLAESDRQSGRTCSSIRPELLASIDASAMEPNPRLDSIVGSIGYGEHAPNSSVNQEYGSVGGSNRDSLSMNRSQASGSTVQSDQTGSTRSSALSGPTGTTGNSSALTLSELPGLSTLVSLDNLHSTQMTASVVTTLSSARTWDMSQLSSRGTGMGAPIGDSMDRPSSMVATTTNSADDIDLAEDMRLMNRY